MKNQVTNIVMMQAAVEALREVGAPDAVIAKAEKHLAQLEKPAAKKTGPTKQRIENEKLAHEVAMIMPEDGSPVTNNWIMEHVQGIISASKCTQVMKILIEKGRVEKAPEKGKMFYKLI